jgi:putative component of membrane protein insertase Oxa1/YidC/SpoIIIJ protein YidD
VYSVIEYIKKEKLVFSIIKYKQIQLHLIKSCDFENTCGQYMFIF